MTAAADLVGTWLALVHMSSQSEAAAALGVTRMTINRWERGETAPSEAQQAQMQQEISGFIDLTPEQMADQIAKRSGLRADELLAASRAVNLPPAPIEVRSR